jgi:hypothetical protein
VLLIRETATLIFVVGVLAARLFERRTGKADLALVFMVLTLCTIGVSAWMPGRLSVDDVRLVLTCGGASLLALRPPDHVPERLLVTSTSLVAMVVDVIW